jgi:hypothetical protein
MIITNKFESVFGVNFLGSFEILYELVVFKYQLLVCEQVEFLKVV